MFNIAKINCPGKLKHLVVQVLASTEWRPFFADDERLSILDQLTGGDYNGQVTTMLREHGKCYQHADCFAWLYGAAQLTQGNGDLELLAALLGYPDAAYDMFGEFFLSKLTAGQPRVQMGAIKAINTRLADVKAYTNDVEQTARKLLDTVDTWFPLFDDEDAATEVLMDLRSSVLTRRVPAIEAVNAVLAANADALALQREVIAYIHDVRREAQELVDIVDTWSVLVDNRAASQALVLDLAGDDLSCQLDAIAHIRGLLADVVRTPDGKAVVAPAWLVEARQVA